MEFSGLNLLFGLATGLVAIGVFWLILKVVPAEAWEQLPPEVLQWKQPVIRMLMLLLFLVTFVNAFSAYGPRLTVDAARLPPPPQRQAIVESPVFIEPVDRIGQFDERRESEDPRKTQEDL